MARLKMLVLTTFALALLLGLTACSKSPEERTCEHYYQDVFTYHFVFTGPSALAELKKLVGELDEIAQEAEPEIANAATRVKEVVMAADKTITEESIEVTGVLEAACDSLGYDYDHFHPNQVIE